MPPACRCTGALAGLQKPVPQQAIDLLQAAVFVDGSLCGEDGSTSWQEAMRRMHERHGVACLRPEL